MKKWWSILAAGYLLLVNLAFAQQDEQKNIAPAQSLAELEQQLISKAEALNIPGFQAAIFDQAGTQWIFNYGVARKPDIAVNDDTLFRVGSTSKTFIALAIVQLVNQGKFDWQDRLVDIAPEVKFSNPYAETHPVRLIHLLEHTTGFDDMHFKNMYNMSQPTISVLDAVNRDATAMVVRWHPGTRTAYSNPGYGILGYLIEKYSGETFERYVQQQVLNPLGMQASSFISEDEMAQYLSHGFEDGEIAPNYAIYLRAAGALNANAIELAKLGHWLLSRGQTKSLPYISADDIVAMETQQSTLAAAAGFDQTYGKAISATTKHHVLWRGHSGGIAGFLSNYAYSTKLGTGYAFTMNSSSSSMRQMTDLISHYLAKDVMPATVEGDSHFASDLPGYYRMANDRNQIAAGLTFPTGILRLYSEQDQLVIDPVFGSAERFTHNGDNRFVEVGSDIPVGVFISHPDYGPVIDITGVYAEKISWFSAWWPVVIVLFGLLAWVLSVLHLPVWLVNLMLKKFEQKGRLATRLCTSLAGLSLVAAIAASTQLSLNTLGLPTTAANIIFVATLTFALFAILALVCLIKFWPLPEHIGTRSVLVFEAVGLSCLAVYFYSFGYIGLQLWAW